MKIEDYIHLYIGQQVVFTPSGYEAPEEHQGIIVEVPIQGTECGIIEFYNDTPIKQYAFYPDIKLVLRHLPDMTESELKDHLCFIYNEIFQYKPEIKTFQILCEDEERLGLTINIDRGIVFSTNGQELMVNQFELTMKLLKQGFDLLVTIYVSDQKYFNT